jgi:hypothetical protein
MAEDQEIRWSSEFGRTSMIFEELRALHDELKVECAERRARVLITRERAAELRARSRRLPPATDRQ